MIHDSLLDLIGRTPIVRLGKLSARLGVSVFAKLESFNPGGSHKARIALGMILDAERKGILVRGTGQTILEPSGGNTGLGLAIAGNILGYHVTLVIPDNYSAEKRRLLELYGARVMLSDSRTGNNSHGELAFKLLLENPQFVMLNQQRNPANPQAHREATAVEILSDFSGQPRPDFFFAGIGTGGHLTGVGEVLKAHWPDLVVYGVQPEQCDLLNNQHAQHEIQGLSIGIVPEVCNLDIVTGMVGVSKFACLSMIREVLRSDSVSLGLSSAANLVAVQTMASDMPPGARVLTMIYDGVESYMDAFQ
ncbi:PLP-dependent cysteine synthase family protein [Burkholderia sp. Ac-20379]|uniref:PLP-dependent cysteine synthase family protein n=1 Tax=Burkholderia sp. Ac-20379 TaxID=2703900 RepID=UPI00197E92B9|nr:PLP-dependent cysteine synthase family protein [Burkholderia sp. Ac-20379]MBN3724576.1 PLP-dependent cysteine synthase family protein [Burkholderia sp. Ac-20379]